MKRQYCSSINFAKILALKTGLTLAIHMDIRYLEINIDSQVLVNLLSNQDPPANLTFLINDCRCLLSQLNNYKLSHCWQECNEVADALAKEGNTTTDALTTFVVPSSFTLPAFNKNLVSTTYSRIVSQFSFNGREARPNLYPIQTLSSNISFIFSTKKFI